MKKQYALALALLISFIHLQADLIVPGILTVVGLGIGHHLLSEEDKELETTLNNPKQTMSVEHRLPLSTYLTPKKLSPTTAGFLNGLTVIAPLFIIATTKFIFPVKAIDSTDAYNPLGVLAGIISYGTLNYHLSSKEKNKYYDYKMGKLGGTSAGLGLWLFYCFANKLNII